MITAVRAISGAVSRVFDLLLAPFASHPAWAMVLVSVVSAIWALLLFKAVTPQTRLQTTRDQLFGHIYEMGLYQDHLGILARIQGDLARTNLRYLGYTLPALVVLAIPMILTLGQLESRFAQRPLKVGEETVLTIKLKNSALAGMRNITLETPAGVQVSAGPVRNESTGTLAWRLQAGREGTHRLRFLREGSVVGTCDLPVGGGLPRLHNTNENSALGVLLYPGAPDLSTNSPLAGLSLQWPGRVTSYLGLKMNWLVAFMVFSMLGGLVLKDLLKVSL